ncbi:THUMP domain-containing protein 3 [Frankliniella fusca]|uniref:THUMP domain-containing protein 3 n=1 Tax=Frankliniella fusca TaxID=407009 RepID=A0AAE1H169_9NEOP|nr:THUMP domain-containing protein 3 [Frankliniella fusca]
MWTTPKHFAAGAGRTVILGFRHHAFLRSGPEFGQFGSGLPTLPPTAALRCARCAVQCASVPSLTQSNRSNLATRLCLLGCACQGSRYCTEISFIKMESEQKENEAVQEGGDVSDEVERPEKTDPRAIGELINRRSASEITIEATVDTGFEFMAIEECRAKFGKDIHVVKERGRIIFNIDKAKYSEVLQMRSVDNLFLVLSYDSSVGFQGSNSVDDIAIAAKQAHTPDWDCWLNVWKELVGFKGIVRPTVEEYASANERATKDKEEEKIRQAERQKKYKERQERHAAKRALRKAKADLKRAQYNFDKAEALKTIETDNKDDTVIVSGGKDICTGVCAETSLVNKSDPVKDDPIEEPSQDIVADSENDKLVNKSDPEKDDPIEEPSQDLVANSENDKLVNKCDPEKDDPIEEPSQDIVADSENEKNKSDPEKGDPNEEPSQDIVADSEIDKQDDLVEEKIECGISAEHTDEVKVSSVISPSLEDAEVNDDSEDEIQSLPDYDREVDLEIDRTVPEEERVLRFRATCFRVGKHCFGSMEAAREFGGALQDKFNWVVDLVNFHAEIILFVVKDTAQVSIALTKKSLHRRNISFFGPTTLRSTVCHNLLRLADVRTGDIVLDPLAGGGSVPIEGAMSFPGTFHIGGDNHYKAMSRLYSNVRVLHEEIGKDLPIGAVRWDARRLPLNEASVDVIVSDLPFGVRLGSKAGNRNLYRRVLLEMARVTRPGSGRAILLTQDRRSFALALVGTMGLWWQSKVMSANIGGLDAAVFTLRRTPKVRPDEADLKAAAELAKDQEKWRDGENSREGYGRGRSRGHQGRGRGQTRGRGRGGRGRGYPRGGNKQSGSGGNWRDHGPKESLKTEAS